MEWNLKMTDISIGFGTMPKLQYDNIQAESLDGVLMSVGCYVIMGRVNKRKARRLRGGKGVDPRPIKWMDWNMMQEYKKSEEYMRLHK